MPFRIASPDSTSTATNGLGQSLFHAHVEGKKLRGHLFEELSFLFNACQRVNLLPPLVDVSEDFQPLWGNLSSNPVPVREQKTRHVYLKLTVIFSDVVCPQEQLSAYRDLFVGSGL